MAQNDSELKTPEQLAQFIVEYEFQNHEARYKSRHELVAKYSTLITAYKDKAVEEALERLPLDCANCGVRTSFLEADLRKFNTGMCGACGADALHTGFWAINAERNKLKERDDE